MRSALFSLPENAGRHFSIFSSSQPPSLGGRQSAGCSKGQFVRTLRSEYPHAWQAMDPADWSILKSTAFFRAMPDEDARSLIGNQNPRAYAKGVTLFRQGEPASAFFVVLSGWVKLYRITPDGLEVVLNVFKTGETFAEAAMFLGGRYPACAETVSPSRLLRIEAAVFRSRIIERPELALSMLASASRQLKSLIAQIEQIKVRSAPQRIAEFIIGLAPKGGHGPAEIELPFEKN